jgi:hypothetical protein
MRRRRGRGNGRRPVNWSLAAAGLWSGFDGLIPPGRRNHVRPLLVRRPSLLSSAAVPHGRATGCRRDERFDASAMNGPVEAVGAAAERPRVRREAGGVKSVIRVAVVAALIASFVGAGSASAATPNASGSSAATLATADADRAALQEQREALAAKVGVRPPGIPCWSNVIIQAHANRLYVATEVGLGGVLRARTPSGQVGAWELYRVCRDPGTQLSTIKSQINDLYVTMEVGLGGLLRARTPVNAVGDWEFFYTGAPPGHNTVIQSYVSRAYTSTEIGEAGLLRARSGTIGLWEVYTWAVLV